MPVERWARRARNLTPLGPQSEQDEDPPQQKRSDGDEKDPEKSINFSNEVVFEVEELGLVFAMADAARSRSRLRGLQEQP